MSENLDDLKDYFRRRLADSKKHMSDMIEKEEQRESQIRETWEERQRRNKR